MSNPLHSLGDAFIIAVLLVALLCGVDVRIIFAIYLGLEIFSKLCRAFTAFMTPIADALKKAAT